MLALLGHFLFQHHLRRQDRRDRIVVDGEVVRGDAQLVVGHQAGLGGESLTVHRGAVRAAQVSDVPNVVDHPKDTVLAGHVLEVELNVAGRPATDDQLVLVQRDRIAPAQRSHDAERLRFGGHGATSNNAFDDVLIRGLTIPDSFPDRQDRPESRFRDRGSRPTRITFSGSRL